MRRLLLFIPGMAVVAVLLAPASAEAVPVPACLKGLALAAARPPQPRCNSTALPVSSTLGRAPHCTIRGTPGNDTLWGSTRRDVICGLGGDDRIYGVDGPDLLLGGAGKDRLHGGPGQDESFGGDGNDRIFGGIGRDVMAGDRGNDRLLGGPAFDDMQGDKDNDVLLGGPGGDYILDDAGNNLIRAGAGRDTVFAFGARDVVYAGAGNDGCVSTKDGNNGDILYGGKGGADTFNANRFDVAHAFEVGPVNCVPGC